MKPLVFLYKTPFGYYFYETGRNEIVQVNKELYQYIKAIIDDWEPGITSASSKTKVEYHDLQECGYLSPPRVQNIQHPLTNDLNEMLTRKVDKITLQVTQNCNLRCSYCIYSENSNFGQRTHSHKAMSLDTAKRALDFYRNNAADTDLIGIGFYGGEPLLEFDLIKSVVAYAQEIFEGKEISFSITTNATLLSEAVIDFLLKYNFKILISIDGPEKVQNKNRRFKDGSGSYKLVMKNISRLYDKDPDKLSRLKLSIVIEPSADYYEIISLFDEPVMKNVGLTYSFVEENAQTLPPSKEYTAEYSYDMFLAFVKYFRSSGKSYPSKLVEQDIATYKEGNKRFKTSILSAISAPSGPCVPGKTRLFMTCSGDLYPCERVNENCCMKIGNLEDGYDMDNIKTILNVGQANKERCKNCWAFSLCTMCVKRADDNGKLSEKRIAFACRDAKAIAIDRIANKILAYEQENHERKMCKVRGEKSV